MKKRKLTIFGLMAAVVVLCACALCCCGKNDDRDGKPVIDGPASLTVKEGYARTTIDGFTVAGANVTSYKESGDDRIVWSSINNNLSIVAGLEIGEYDVVIVATNGDTQQDCTLDFTLTVEDRFNCVDGWYLISTPEEFNAMHSVKEGDLDKNYKLMNDLDFEGKEALFSNSEPGSPKRALTGVFDGNGYAIKNAKVAKTEANSTWRMGIFGHVKNGTVRNLKFIDIIAYDVVSEAAGVAFGCVEGKEALVENIYFETRLTHAQNGKVQPECGNSAFIGWLTNGAQVRNVVTVITTAENVEDFRQTALFVGLTSNGTSDVKLTNAFAITKSTSVTNISNGNLGSGKFIKENVKTYADKTALLAEQGELMGGWDQKFWSFLFV